MRLSILFIVAGGLFYACTPQGKPNETQESNGPNAGLIGAWKWSQTTFQSPDTSYTWNNVSGQIMFTDKYYNFIYVWKSGARPETRNVPFDSLTLDEIREAIGSVGSNAGSYSIEGDSIVFQRDVALWPNSMTTNSRWTLPLPTQSADSLIWSIGSYNHIWIRRQ